MDAGDYFSDLIINCKISIQAKLTILRNYHEIACQSILAREIAATLSLALIIIVFLWIIGHFNKTLGLECLSSVHLEPTEVTPRLAFWDANLIIYVRLGKRVMAIELTMVERRCHIRHCACYSLTQSIWINNFPEWTNQLPYNQ